MNEPTRTALAVAAGLLAALTLRAAIAADIDTRPAYEMTNAEIIANVDGSQCLIYRLDWLLDEHWTADDYDEAVMICAGTYADQFTPQ